MKLAKGCLIIAVVVALFVTNTVFAGTLDDVKAQGVIKVGVNEGLFGFSKADENGVWRGLDVDTARAISVAVFNDPDKIKFVRPGHVWLDSSQAGSNKYQPFLI